MLSRPPNWMQYFTEGLIKKAVNSDGLRELMKQADKEYVYWEKFQHLPKPEGFSSQEAWAYLKFSRMSNADITPIRDMKLQNFKFTITKSMHQKLSLIDSNTSGFLTSASEKPTPLQKNQMIISSLTEEAIASSQIEGANTSRKVAKEMLLSQRKARSKDEQMIINNYQVMQRLMDWKDLKINLNILLDIQKNITAGTLENESDSGRLRYDSDGINVVNKLTGETVYTPPKAEVMKKELERFITFANTDESEEEFIHPVIKAGILHFWLAYLHPFVDGNGRTARALFYWYLLRKNYWMFQYLSVSRIIKKSKIQYDNSYLYAEYDENDLTYFLSYSLKAIVLSIKEFITHYQSKLEKEKIIQKLAGQLGEFNERQVSLLQDLNTNRDKTIEITTYKSKNRLSYETARSDLMFLVKKQLLDKIHSGKKYVFIPNTVSIAKLFQIKTNK